MGLGALLENQLAIVKVPEVAHIPSLYPRGVKLSLFLLYGQHFPRYGPYLGMKLDKSPKFQNLHIYILFTPQRFEIELIFALRAAVCKIQVHFQNSHIWA